VAVAPQKSVDGWRAEDSIEELARLAETAGADVVGSMIQHLNVPTKTHYLGKGKTDELLALKSKLEYDVVIFNDELSPIQQRNLEEVLQVKIIDRVALILDIFSERARTREGQLQVELAQSQYLLPRLAGQWCHLERLGGGIGTRGPGETQIETDRRLVRNKIQKLKKQIDEVRKRRTLYRQNRKRSGVQVVSLVGYTNSGKSTLLNGLSSADVLAEDKLFATLDPTTRKVNLPGNKQILVTDTVGFIHKLPHTIVDAFRATLEELEESDLLLHVVDFTLHNAAEQCQTVEEVLKELKLQDKPRITVLNKIDRLLDSNRAWDEISAFNQLAGTIGEMDEKTVIISATKKWGYSRLLEVIKSRLP